MEEWRSAIDERTGRTYWYHRITRESTWTKPPCLQSAESLQSLPKQQNENSNDHEKGFQILLQMLEGLGGPDILVELLHEQSPDLQQEAIQLFLSCCIPSTVFYLAKEFGAIDGLINIIMLSSTETPTRRNALRSLCCLALNQSAHEFFVTNQGWISLAVHFMKWPDIESTLLFIILICLLLSGKARSLISKDIILLLKQFLDHNCPYSPDKYGNLPQPLNLSVFDTHPSSQGVSLLDGSVLTQFAGKSNLFGGELPGTVLVTLAGHCLRSRCLFPFFSFALRDRHNLEKKIMPRFLFRKEESTLCNSNVEPPASSLRYHPIIHSLNSLFAHSHSSSSPSSFFSSESQRPRL
jgi:hypothetical protein